MPRPQNPPTPTSSTEIKSKDGSQYPPLQMSFELPPPAVAANNAQLASNASRKTSTTSSQQTGSSTTPASAGELVKTRRRSSILPAPSKDDTFALPPPPTRSRKIIQMKPRTQPEEQEEVMEETSKTPAKSATASKKKQPSSTSVAGRKIARKTAHSLIERRRRSKMNEEFGVLKDMIPACIGDMHKLAILQASIDYIRYLEECISKLKTSKAQSQRVSPSEQFTLPPPASLASYAPRQYHPSEHDQDDIDMEGSDQATSPTNTAHLHSQNHSTRPSVSPAILPQDRLSSYSSASTDNRHYSFSAGTSPALLPQLGAGMSRSNGYGSALTSPALIPQRGSIGERDLDHEATAALLMLNTDRRGIPGVGSGRGMSVRDLLSS